MATWEDGPEYAPEQRPVEFVEPDPAEGGTQGGPDGGRQGATALSVAPPRPRPSAGAPTSRPRFEQRHQVRPLPEHDVVTESPRDPTLAFRVNHSTMTTAPEQSVAWGAAHMPIQLSSTSQLTGPAPAPAPGQPIGQAPPMQPGGALQPGPMPSAPMQPGPPPYAGPGQPAPNRGAMIPANPYGARGLPPLTFGSFYRSLTPFVLFSLLGAGIINPISIFLYAAAFWFSVRWPRSRSEYYRSVVTNTYWVGAGLIGTTMVVGLLMGPTSIGQWWELTNQISQIAGFATLAVITGAICHSLNIGRAPDPDPQQQPQHGIRP